MPPNIAQKHFKASKIFPKNSYDILVFVFVHVLYIIISSEEVRLGRPGSTTIAVTSSWAEMFHMQMLPANVLS